MAGPHRASNETGYHVASSSPSSDGSAWMNPVNFLWTFLPISSQTPSILDVFLWIDLWDLQAMHLLSLYWFILQYLVNAPHLSNTMKGFESCSQKDDFLVWRRKEASHVRLRAAPSHGAAVWMLPLRIGESSFFPVISHSVQPETKSSNEPICPTIANN